MNLRRFKLIYVTTLFTVGFFAMLAEDRAFGYFFWTMGFMYLTLDQQRKHFYDMIMILNETIKDLRHEIDDLEMFIKKGVPEHMNESSKKIIEYMKDIAKKPIDGDEWKDR